MKTKLLIALTLLTMLLSSCGTEKRRRLESKVDSLMIIVKENEQVIYTLQEVGILLDSIDANRAVLRATMVEGTTLKNYTERLKSINRYVGEVEGKIVRLEQNMKSMRTASTEYKATINHLRAQLVSANEQMSVLRSEGLRLRDQNGMLITQVSEKDTVINQQARFIKVKEQELATREAEAREMNDQTRVDKSNLYFAQAEALELAASRTKFAPHKRRVTRLEALELYKISLMLGNSQAQERINKLEKQV